MYTNNEKSLKLYALQNKSMIKIKLNFNNKATNRNRTF